MSKDLKMVVSYVMAAMRSENQKKTWSPFNGSMLDSFAQWWFGDISDKDHSTKKKCCKKEKNGKRKKRK